MGRGAGSVRAPRRPAQHLGSSRTPCPCLFTSNICAGTLGRGAARRAASWHAHRWRLGSIWAAEQRRCAFTHAPQIKQVTLEGFGSLLPSPCREPWARQHSLAAKFLETAPASGGEKPRGQLPKLRSSPRSAPSRRGRALPCSFARSWRLLAPAGASPPPPPPHPTDPGSTSPNFSLRFPFTWRA